MSIKTSFATRLKALREREGLNQGQLAKELGISRGSISFYENGDRIPDIETFDMICDFFNVSYDYLLGKSDLEESSMEVKAIRKYTGLSEKAIDNLHTIIKQYPLRQCLINFLLADGLGLFCKLREYIVLKTIEEAIKEDDIYRYIPIKRKFTDSRIAFADIIEVLPGSKNDFKKMLENEPEKKTELCMEYLSVTVDNNGIKDAYGYYALAELMDNDDDIYEETSSTDFDIDEDCFVVDEEFQKELDEEEKERKKTVDCIEIFKSRLAEYKKSKGAKLHG